MPTRQDNELNNACSKGRLRRVREILEKGGDVVSMLETRLGFLGYTPMHEAACQGYDDILRLLLIYGGDVNARANGNYTPLHIAASMNYVKCIEVHGYYTIWFSVCPFHVSLVLSLACSNALFYRFC